MIDPHGGKLVNLYVNEAEQEQYREEVAQLPQVILDDKNISDLEMIASGAMSPLTGFMTQQDYRSVVDTMHLKSGIVWSLPITLAVKKDIIGKIEKSDEVCLLDHNQNPLAILKLEEIYQYDKKIEAEKVFRTDDADHPGVNYVYQQGEYYIGGPI
ncbi:MAG: sulfate adenylyltransferase, partial [Calditrichia bacterium]|nr:sulfate adenylyltransferase [Calditrichia bacterium]